MILMSTNDISRIVFVVVVVIIVLVILTLFLYVPVKRKIYEKKFKELYYHKIYKLALYKDYYLINDFIFQSDSSVSCIDHILFGEKYIYFIIDLYFAGDIMGKADDKSLIYIPRRGEKCYTDNPLIRIEKYVKRVSILTNLDSSLLIGIVLVNNECHTAIMSESKQYYVIQEKRLKALVKAIESREVGKLNEEQLDRAVKSIDKMNRKRRK